MAAAISSDQYQALRQGVGVFVREDRGRILLRGSDRKSYLQGLLSNDILALHPGSSCYAALLTAQGRMISDMRVFDLDDSLLMDLEAAVTPRVVEHLERFVITEEVAVDDVTARWAQIGLYGPEARAALERATAAGAGTPLFVLPSDDIGVTGLDVIVEADRLPSWLEALERAGAVRVDASTVETTRIEAGIPRFLVDMDATTIPLEAGIERRAISMSKGCYVGQEVIVRVLHRGGGRVARRLVPLAVEGDARAGDVVVADGREVGRVTSAARSPRAGQPVALASVHRDYVAPSTELTVRTARGDVQAVVLEKPVADR